MNKENEQYFEIHKIINKMTRQDYYIRPDASLSRSRPNEEVRDKKSGNEWIWTTDQGLMSPLLYH